MSMVVYSLFGAVPCYIGKPGSPDPKAQQDWEAEFDAANPGATEEVGVSAPIAGAGTAPASDPAHPAEQVVEQPSPLEGKPVLFRALSSIEIESPRYATVPNLFRAVQWGSLLFGATSFVIVRQVAEPDPPFLVIGTDDPLRAEELTLSEPKKFAGRDAQTIQGRMRWAERFTGSDQKEYAFWTLMTAEGLPAFPLDPVIWDQFHLRYEADRQTASAIADSDALKAIFDKIDGLLADGSSDSRDQAVQRLVALNADAFRLCAWEQKALYVVTLLKGWDTERHEAAVVEIFRAMESQAEFEAVLQVIREEGMISNLVNEMDTHLWGLLAVIGEKFGDDEPFTLQNFLNLMAEAEIDLLTIFQEFTAIYSPVQTDIEASYTRMMAMIHSLGRVGGEILTTLKQVVTEGDKIIDGVVRLGRLAHVIHLATVKDDPDAEKFLDAVLQQVLQSGRLMAQQAHFVLKGLALLKEGRLVVQRITTSLLIEVASWFVGAGEVKALIKGAKLLKELKWLRRIRRAFAALGLAADAEKLAARLEKVAKVVIKTVDAFGTADGLLQVLSLLPDATLKPMVEAISRASMEGKEYTDLDDLKKQHKTLGEATEQTLEYALTLWQFGQAADGLDEDVAGAFAVLVEGGWTA